MKKVGVRQREVAKAKSKAYSELYLRLNYKEGEKAEIKLEKLWSKLG